MTGKVSARDLARQLKNVGPRMAQRLIDAKIDSPEKLRKLGTKAAFQKLYKNGDAYGDYNAAYMYALEGAIRNCDWTEIPDKVKQQHKEFARELQAEKKG